MIKMTRVYGDMYAPREYCTFTNPVTSGGTEEVDYVDMPCENGCNKVCENCTLQKIMNEYARLTRQDIDEKKRHCEECENYKEIRKGPRGGKKGICRILRPSEIRNGRARACKRFRVQKNEYRIQCKKEMDLGQQEKVYEWLKQRVNRYGKAVAENEKD